ncbi:transcriptional regulator [Peribacillus simplex]|uniref:Transcriptional regulator n=2 Tax=Peribacillus TaxID=2675229 RepID=A0AA90T4J5_9BACI|nr:MULTISPECIES: transcriptional regulator [Peribacillus]MDP1420147.1 transcriptional regulator [Peribacillus simplex]MDP1453763.1 transcriptional regulator [Peribacillus frigoritolerans]
MIKIGVITAPHSISEIKRIEPHIQDQCELTFLPYRQISEIKELYERNHLFFDGILFSGALGFTILQQEYTVFQTPVYFLDIPEGDFYKRLFTISNSNENLNFARVCMDLLSKENNNMGLKEVLKEDEFPFCLQLEYSEAIYEKAFQQYLSLWQQGKIDLVITRISNIVGLLNQAGIPNIFIFPSKESILEQIKHIINELQISNLLENQWAIGVVTIKGQEDMSDLEFKQILLHKALLEFNEKENALSVIQKKHASFEIITSQADLRRLTKEYTRCFVLQYLNEVLPFQVNIGWGIGTTLYQAKTSAQTANKQAESHDFPCTYAITANEEVVGPLGDDTCLHIMNTVDPQLEKLSETLDVSILRIQKIIAVISKLQTNELTAEDLAYHLRLTLRQANRILNNLEDKGVAHISYRKQEKLRGRPKKVYKIDFRTVSK